MREDDPLHRFRLPRCINCGYDLRGSWESERCPECGEECDSPLLVQVFGRPFVSYACLAFALFLVTVAIILSAKGKTSFAVFCLLYGAVSACVGVALFRTRHNVRLDSLGAIISRRSFLVVQGRQRYSFGWSHVRSWEILPEVPDPRSKSTQASMWTLKARHEIQISPHADPRMLGMILAADEAVLQVDFDATGREAAALKAELTRRFEQSRAVAEAPDHQ